MRARTPILSAGVLALALLTTPHAAYAQSRPGDRQFTIIQGHDPLGLERAVETGAGVIRAGGAREFRVYVGGRAVFQLIRGVPSVVQKKIASTVSSTRGLVLVACKETIDVIVKQAKARPPLIANARIETCNGRRQQLRKEGWQDPIGF